MAVKDSDGATLHCSIRRYCLAILNTAMENEHTPVCEGVHMMQVDIELILR